MVAATEELPISIVVMRYVQYRAPEVKHVIAAKRHRVLRLREGPTSVEAMRVS